MYCPLTTTGAGELVAHTGDDTKFVVDCKVSPGLLVGHVKIIELGGKPPEPGFNVTASMGGGPDPDSNVGENTAVLSPATS